MPLNPCRNVMIDGRSLAGFLSNQYELEVSGVVITIMSNRIGALLIQEISRKLHIVPFDEYEFNAQSIATDGRAAVAANTKIFDCETGAEKPYKGIGGGSDSIIEFSPALWRRGGFGDVNASYRAKKLGGQVMSDEVLFHEMVHSVRQMIGKQNCSTYPDNFHTHEEVWSIMTTNIYSSAWGRPLRRDHSDFATMTPAEIGGFYQKFESMIGEMCRDMPRFTRAVSLLASISFNPFRDYYDPLKKKR